MKVINYPSLFEEPIVKKMLLDFDKGIVMNLQLKQGEKIPRHFTPFQAIIIVNEGEVYFRSGDKEVILKPGILGNFDVEDDHEFEAIKNSSIVLVKINGK